jgi:hypothetical protein
VDAKKHTYKNLLLSSKKLRSLEDHRAKELKHTGSEKHKITCRCRECFTGAGNEEVEVNDVIERNEHLS